ncbi:hypothetical protein BMS3Abin17_00223 [archaeon BMS3Abin17]|nr:hypothetical protein BMS3Abin17_00223 [archaeon BMS3Abin17]HDZ60791.1 hypothetical protein [Candidatus Pacearchaeota archaeon]
MEKRGLSTVVTTMIIIVLVLVAAGMVWVVIRNLLSSGSDKITIERFAISLEITSVEKGGTYLYVKVKRNVGGGNLLAIKFILSDDKNSEVVEKPTDIKELETRTFRIGQEDCNFVNISNVTKVSIAPVFELRSGRTSLGDIVIAYNIKEVGGEDLFSKCVVDFDCGMDTLINNTEECGDGGDLYQEWMNYTCRDQECYSEINLIKIADCNDTGCEDGACLEESIGCTLDEDCVVFDSESSGIYCVGNESYQDWNRYFCNITNNECEFETVPELVNNCTLENKICGSDGNCYEAVECMSDSDCDNKCGDTYCMCLFSFNTTCVPEVRINLGVVDSIWPPEGANYFDSPNLNKTDKVFLNDYMGFVSGNESGNECRLIEESVYLSELDNAYVKISGLPIEITTGDGYEIWETKYNCDKRLSDLGL